MNVDASGAKAATEMAGDKITRSPGPSTLDGSLAHRDARGRTHRHVT
jgi:hypothetical protein